MYENCNYKYHDDTGSFIIVNTDMHFFLFHRCIKPNEQKLPDKFQPEIVLHQLRTNGLIEIARIRQLGYPVRIAFAEFIEK